jgi:hypothetical protein
MTNEQALNNLYAASRLAPLRAEEHELLRKCAEQLAEAIAPQSDEPSE